MMKEFSEPDDWQDRPEVNLEFKEIERNFRADEFNDEAQRLSIYREDDYYAYSSRYELPDESTIDVCYQDYPEGSASTIIWTVAPYKTTSADGQKRRATCSRIYTFRDIPELSQEELEEISKDLEEATEEFGLEAPSSESEDWFAQRKEKRNFHISMGDVELPEKVSAHTTVDMQVKLPNWPNYRTEHSGTLATERQRQIHYEAVEAARNHSGIREDAHYSPQEHAELMNMLRRIDPTEIEPTAVLFDF